LWQCVHCVHWVHSTVLTWAPAVRQGSIIYLFFKNLILKVLGKAPVLNDSPLNCNMAVSKPLDTCSHHINGLVFRSCSMLCAHLYTNPTSATSSLHAV
jgi:hypothetical protein